MRKFRVYVNHTKTNTSYTEIEADDEDMAEELVDDAIRSDLLETLHLNEIPEDNHVRIAVSAIEEIESTIKEIESDNDWDS